jgi:flagellar basal-body rod modification protein FlgD
MSPTTNSVTSSTTAPPAPPTAASTDPLASESTFLTLLVSQLQNQDPLNPPDTNQFVGQLTAYSQLEQLINIDKNTTVAPPATPGTTPTSTSNTGGI